MGQVFVDRRPEVYRRKLKSVNAVGQGHSHQGVWVSFGLPGS